MSGDIRDGFLQTTLRGVEKQRVGGMFVYQRSRCSTRGCINRPREYPEGLGEQQPEREEKVLKMNDLQEYYASPDLVQTGRTTTTEIAV